MLNRSASLTMSTCILKALPGKLDTKRLSPSILYLYGVLNQHDSLLVQEYRKKIDYLESAELEKDTLKDENFRLRDEMQAR